MENKTVRPTKIKCQTRFACKDEYSSFSCEQCKLLFCLKCVSRHDSHKYTKLKTISEDEICESNCKNTLPNMADLICNICSIRYCWKCFREFDKVHFSKKDYFIFEKEVDGPFFSVKLECIPPKTMIFDEFENFKFSSAVELTDLLKVSPSEKFLVISIIGRTGDGKSHCLNKTFFNGVEVFKTDPGQSRCTVGAWVAIAKAQGYMLIDTEGLQGESTNPGQQKRLLMKILAVSDLVIYRTKDSRLNQEIFDFIGDSFVTFDKYFRAKLEKKAEDYQCKPEMLAPAFLLVHSVDHTNIPEDQKFIIERIRKSKKNVVISISNILYEGFKSTDNSSDDLIDYKKLETRIKDIFKDVVIRAPRTCEFIFNCMTMLNQIFNSNIESKPDSFFPDEYFSCIIKCESCGVKCELSMNHDGRHKNISSCKLKHKLQNYVYLCKACSHSTQGPERFLVPKPISSGESPLSGALSYLWRGVIIECEKCGILYKSREHWYGNSSPDNHPKLIQKIIHFWPGDQSLISSVHPIGQRCIESVSDISNEIAKWSNPTLKVVKDTIVDAYLPEGMQRNSEITNCGACDREIDTLIHPVHHCRQCAKGVCDKCSNYFLEFPKHGKQRVCFKCCEESKKENFKKNILPDESPSFQIFKYATKTSTILGTLAKAPLSVAKMVAQPSYWQSDCDCGKCPICERDFDVNWLPIHHCRSCGKGVCDSCSQARVPVPFRGIDNPQRVCNLCFKHKKYELPSE